MAYSFIIQQEINTALHFEFSFAANWENLIEIYDNATGALICSRNIDIHPYLPFDIAKNTSGAVKLFRIEGKWKQTREGWEAWHGSWGRVRVISATETRYEYEDQNRGTFDNAIATMTIYRE